MLFEEKKEVFQGRVSLYGRIFGLATCKLEFSLNDEETDSGKAN